MHSNFDLTESQRGRQEIYASSNIHKLQREGDGFRIAFKKALLVRNDDYRHNLTFLI